MLLVKTVEVALCNSVKSLWKDELNVLVNLAEMGTMASGGGAGPASILELASSTNSRGSQFVSLFAMREQALKSGDEEMVKSIEKVYSKEHLDMYSLARRRVQEHGWEVAK